ncbi:hypothetical protein BJY52DRAFT_1395585 [Lactarius psammicola]|nr:hypothetical protein BJY52DRAFT_1395585 [Lactarius psammicola]
MHPLSVWEGWGGGGVDGKRKQASRMMRGTVDEGAGKPRDIVSTQPTNLISTPPHTHPPPLCGRPAVSSSSRARDPLRTGYDHPARTPDALHTGYDNPARTPDSPSRKAMRRGTARPPSPPPIAYAGCATPACSHTRRFAHMLWVQEGRGAVRTRGAPGTRGGATRAANGPGLHSQRRVLACAQRLEDARAGRDGEGRGATQRKAAREWRGVRTRAALPRVLAKAGGCASGAGRNPGEGRARNRRGGHSLRTLAPSKST